MNEQWFNLMDHQSTLLTKTRHLLINRNRVLTYRRIEMATGINRKWLSKFATSQSKNPGVANVEKLYCYLSKQKLEI